MFASDYLSNAPLLVLNSVAALLLPFTAAYSLAKLKEKGRDLQEASRNTMVAALNDRRKKAAQARRAKCEFLAGMSHELRTPMNAVVGYSEMLIDDLEAAGRPSVELGRVHALGILLLSRINDILDFAKLEIGRLPLFPEQILLGEVLVSVDLLQAAKRNGNTLSLNVGEPNRAIDVDIRKFRKIVWSTFEAINALLQEGTIEIRLRHTGDRLVLGVSAIGGKLAVGVLRDLFYGSGSAAEFSDTLKSCRLGLALARELSAFLGGTLALVENAATTGFETDLPLQLGRSISYSLESPLASASRR